MPDPSTTVTEPTKPTSWIDRPNVKIGIGILLAVVLNLLAQRGLTPTPIPSLPAQSTPAVVIVSLTPNGTPMPLATVAGK